MADSVGLALLVVLDTLAPAERLAFVLHDLFAVPFEEIAPIVGRSPRPPGSSPAARAAGCRARPPPPSRLGRQRQVVDAFLAASRDGDFDALIALLDPDVIVRAERGALPSGSSREMRGAQDGGHPGSTHLRAARPVGTTGARQRSRRIRRRLNTAAQSRSRGSPSETTRSSRSTSSPTPNAYARSTSPSSTTDETHDALASRAQEVSERDRLEVPRCEGSGSRTDPGASDKRGGRARPLLVGQSGSEGAPITRPQVGLMRDAQMLRLRCA